MCCWNFFGCGWRNYSHNEYSGYGGHKGHHSSCECKQGGYSNY